LGARKAKFHRKLPFTEGAGKKTTTKVGQQCFVLCHPPVFFFMINWEPEMNESTEK